MTLPPRSSVNVVFPSLYLIVWTVVLHPVRSKMLTVSSSRLCFSIFFGATGPLRPGARNKSRNGWLHAGLLCAKPATHSARHRSRNYNLTLPAAFALAHLALAASDSAFFAAADIFRFPALAGAGEAVPLILAHLALAAAAMAARAAGLIFRRFRLPFAGAPTAATGAGEPLPKMLFSSSCRASILSLRSAALRSAFGVNVVTSISGQYIEHE